MGTLCRLARRLIFFDGRGASPLSENFFAQYGFDRTFQQPGELRAFLRSHLDGSFRVLYQPCVAPPVSLDGHAPGLERHFAAVTQLVIAAGRVLYVVDEIDRFTLANWMPSGLGYVVNQGRHVQVSLAASSRRPAQIPRELTSQAHLFYVFRMTEPRDLSYLEEYIGRESAQRLPRLGDYQYLKWEETAGTAVIGDARGREKKLSN